MTEEQDGIPAGEFATATERLRRDSKSMASHAAKMAADAEQMHRSAADYANRSMGYRIEAERLSRAADILEAISRPAAAPSTPDRDNG